MTKKRFLSEGHDCGSKARVSIVTNVLEVKADEE